MNKKIIENLVIPTLNLNLSLVSTDFTSDKTDEESNLLAKITIDKPRCVYLLKLTSKDKIKITDFIIDECEYTLEHTFSATAIVDDIPIKLSNIWPPHNKTTKIIGYGGSEQSFHFNEIEIPTDTSFDLLDNLPLAEKLLSGLEKNGGVPPEELNNSADPDVGCTEFLYISYLANVKLHFVDSAETVSTRHPFWGNYESSSRISWDGEILGFSFSAYQSENHVKLGIKGKSSCVSDVEKFTNAFIQAFSFMHQISPWETYRELRVNGKVRYRKLRPINRKQGRFHFLNTRSICSNTISPAEILCRLTELFLNLDEKTSSKTEHLCYLFRAADNDDIPIESQMLGVCTVIEGFIKLLPTPKDPEGFTTIKKEAVKWISEKTMNSEQEPKLFWKRLKDVLCGTSYLKIKQKWPIILKPFFGSNEEYVELVIDTFNKHRHNLAHGSPITPDASVINDLGILAGFFNALVLIRCGYSGNILKSPFSSEIMCLSTTDAASD